MTAQFPLPFPPCWLPPVLPLEERAGERRPFNILPQPAQTKKPCNYAIMQLCNDLTANATRQNPPAHTLSPSCLRFACCAAHCQSAGDAARAIEAPNADREVPSPLAVQANRTRPPPIVS